MDRLLFGDNQFFGINHMSEDKAVSQAIRFQKTDAILDTLRVAYDADVTTFMCTTHSRIGEICDRVAEDPEKWERLTFYPSMPYAHKYANAVTDLGMMKAVRSFLPDEGYLDAAMRGGTSVAKKDARGLMTLLIDAELKMFKGLKTPVVFLQNVIVDLILGLGAYDLFKIYADHIASRYEAEPAFITMNLPRLLDALETVSIENPIVCSNLNKIGFRMSGGLENYEQALAEREFRAIAMSVYASGAIPPREALEWVRDRPKIQSVVFGASSKAHIEETAELAREFWPSDG